MTRSSLLLALSNLTIVCKMGCLQKFASCAPLRITLISSPLPSSPTPITTSIADLQKASKQNCCSKPALRPKPPLPRPCYLLDLAGLIRGEMLVPHVLTHAPQHGEQQSLQGAESQGKAVKVCIKCVSLTSAQIQGDALSGQIKSKAKITLEHRMSFGVLQVLTTKHAGFILQEAHIIGPARRETHQSKSLF